MEKIRSVQLTSLIHLTEGSYLLSFLRDFDFQPGQVIGINMGNQQPARLYSIASGNQEKEVRVLFTIKDDGYLTPKLAQCRPGDKIDISEPFGNFICREKDACLIAAGTGIAPFASMIFSGMSEGKTLIHGSRLISQFYFQNELSSLLKQEYIRCCSTEELEGVYYGRLTHYLNERKSLPNNRKYYLCGSAEMVVDTRDILINKGIPYENIMAEIYF